MIGLEPERLEMFHVSSGEGPKFAGLAHEMTERALRLGPNPVRGEARARKASARSRTSPFRRRRGGTVTGTWSDNAGDSGSAQLATVTPWTVAASGGHSKR